MAPGGAGTGLYGLVMMALLAVFIGGLMVGTTPEFLQKRLHARHMKLVSLYILAIPVTVLVGCAIAMALQGPAAHRCARPRPSVGYAAQGRECRQRCCITAVSRNEGGTRGELI